MSIFPKLVEMSKVENQRGWKKRKEKKKKRNIKISSVKEEKIE